MAPLRTTNLTVHSIAVEFSPILIKLKIFHNLSYKPTKVANAYHRTRLSKSLIISPYHYTIVALIATLSVCILSSCLHSLLAWKEGVSLKRGKIVESLLGNCQKRLSIRSTDLGYKTKNVGKQRMQEALPFWTNQQSDMCCQSWHTSVGRWFWWTTNCCGKEETFPSGCSILCSLWLYNSTGLCSGFKCWRMDWRKNKRNYLYLVISKLKIICLDCFYQINVYH